MKVSIVFHLICIFGSYQFLTVILSRFCTCFVVFVKSCFFGFLPHLYLCLVILFMILINFCFRIIFVTHFLKLVFSVCFDFDLLIFLFLSSIFFLIRFLLFVFFLFPFCRILYFFLIFSIHFFFFW